MTSPTPRQILCVGRNYGAHARELGHDVPERPLLFWKPAGSVAPGGTCALPRWAGGPTRIDFEGELALVLARDIGPGTPPLPDDPWDAVGGVVAAIDVSDRDLQKREPQWVRAKGFAGACVLGALAPRPTDPDAIALVTTHDGATVQRGHTRDLLFPFRPLLRYLHGWCRLWAGDVILTGTPEGVGPVAPGSVVEVTLEADGRTWAHARGTFTEGPQVPDWTDLGT